MLSDHQLQIIQKANTQGGQITKKECVEHFGHWYYYNKEKHIGDILSRMVNRNVLIRIKPGVFKVNTQSPKISNNEIFNPDQIKLF